MLLCLAESKAYDFEARNGLCKENTGIQKAKDI